MPENDARAFDITPTPASVQLDGQGEGEVSFTVTSKKGRIRARARVEPQDPARADWYELVGEAERTLDTTDTFVVKVRVPPGAPPGDYRFHLRVVSEVNPDEDFADSAPVGFSVAPREAPKKPFPWWIIALIAGILIVGGLVLWLVLSGGKAKLGDDCSEKACIDGLVCSESEVCVGTVGFDGCRGDEECAAGLTCGIEGDAETGTCLAGVQGACADSSQCAAGLTCDEGTCRGEEGFSPCAAPGDCLGDLFCAGGTCRSDTTGQPCGTGRDCAPGQLCLEISGTRLCLRANGQPCDAFSQCASLLCQNGVCASLPNGASCTSNPQCRSNNCSNGTCTGNIRQCGPGLPACPPNMICLRPTTQPRGTCIFRSVILPRQELDRMRIRPDLIQPPGGGG